MCTNNIFEKKEQIEEMIKKDVEGKENFKVLQVNIRSLRKNWDLIQIQLREIKIKWEIIVFTEINIKKEEEKLYELDGYVNISVTREETTRGGGVMVFIKKEVKYNVKKIEWNENSVIEIIVDGDEEKRKKKDIKKEEIRIIGIYRKPSTNKTVYKKIKKVDWKQ